MGPFRDKGAIREGREERKEGTGNNEAQSSRVGLTGRDIDLTEEGVKKVQLDSQVQLRVHDARRGEQRVRGQDKWS